MRWIHGARARLRLLFRRDAEARMDEEMRFHLEMETQKLVREGMSPAHARRRARLAFGGVEGHREAMRDGRTLAWMGGLGLDLRLGARMLVKYPGLTLVGGVAIAFAIWVGAGTFEFLRQFVYPTLPLPDGGRVVAVRHWDAAESRSVVPTLQDFAAWREELETVEALGAYRALERNLIAPGVPIRPVHLVEMSAAGFRVARTSPLLGRTLVEADERPDAPAVAVLGHELWRTRFGGDPGIVGREIRLGSSLHTVVGVMPAGFEFPVSHNLWIPLRLRALDFPPGEGPEVRVFGRLAPGATLAEARAELSALPPPEAGGRREHLRPQLLPYAESFMNLSGTETVVILAMNLFLVALLVLVCGNVALLMFARAVSRESEIVVRNALGASRGRIIAQLFAEALVLAGVAAAVGLAATDLGLRWMLGALETQITSMPGLPFWIRDRVSPSTVLYACLLTAVGAGIAGVLPALKVTRGLGTRLRRASAGGGGYRFGGVWTAVIVTQIAVTVAFPAAAFLLQREAVRGQSRDVGFATEPYLSVRLEADPAAAAPGDTGAALARARASFAELERRLEADASVRGVSFAGHLPRMNHPDRRIELDEGGAAPVDPRIGVRWVAVTSAAPDYFALLGASVLRGQGFHSGDLEPGVRAVIVNQSFVDRVLGGRNPIGRHVRYLAPDRRDGAESPEEPWHEIVGVVPDLGMGVEPEGIYHPVSFDASAPLHMAVHVRGRPEALAQRVRATAAAVDPTLRLQQVVPLDEVNADRMLAFWMWLVVGVSAVALVLSLAGIYSVMSFTVAKRTREIGIRIALGADARRLAGAIFRRPLAQIAGGIVAGTVLVAALPAVLEMEWLSAKGFAVVTGYSLFMTGVCLLACVVPTRRALRVEPTQVLQGE